MGVADHAVRATSTLARLLRRTEEAILKGRRSVMEGQQAWLDLLKAVNERRYGCAAEQTAMGKGVLMAIAQVLATTKDNSPYHLATFLRQLWRQLPPSWRYFGIVWPAKEETLALSGTLGPLDFYSCLYHSTFQRTRSLDFPITWNIYTAHGFRPCMMSRLPPYGANRLPFGTVSMIIIVIVNLL